MQRLAWLVMLGWIVGCSQSTPAPKIAESSKPKTVVVPVDVELLFEKGELAKAIERLTSLIDAQPRDESLYALRATAYHRLGRSTEALTDLDHAISINDHDASLYNNRGFIRLGIEQFTAAAEDLNKATELSPNYMNAFNNRGLLYIAQGKYDDAIAQFNRAIEIDNQYIDAYNNRGFAEFEAGKLGQALDDFNVAIQLNSDYVNAYNNRGLLRARAGDFENAVVDFTQAMMIDPLNPKYYEHRRDVYQKRSEFDKAIQDDKKIAWLLEYHHLSAEIAATTNPANKLVLRAKHFLKVENNDKAMDDLNRALEFDSQSAEALATRAGVHLQKKSIAEAKADAEAALAIAQKDEAYSILGDVYLSQGEYDRAIENFARARRIDTSVADAYYARSKELAKKGQDDQAKMSLEQALALDPDVESRLR